MSPVEFKKGPCRPVEFKGQGPQTTLLGSTRYSTLKSATANRPSSL